MPGVGQFQSALDGLPRTSFGSLVFPCAHHRLRGSFRKHRHEWPHRPAGASEKLGRGIYSISVRGEFHDTLDAYPDLYPRTINDLQLMYEQGTTATFVHPTVGRFNAFISEWDRYTDPRVRSGEVVDMEFEEDQNSNFLTQDIINSAHFASLGPSADEVANQLAAVQAQLVLPPPVTGVSLPPSVIAAQLNVTTADLSLFDALQTVANDIAGIGDTASLYGNLVSAKAQQLANICAEIDQSLSMQDARAYYLVDAIHNLWELAVRIQQDSQQKRVLIQTYFVPTTMPLTSIANALYGDASRAEDLLALNQIDDPLRVPAGTPISYYPATTSQAA